MKSNRSAIYKLRGALLARGFSLRRWARQEGFNYDLVLRAVHRYWGATKRPRGPLTKAIIERLRESAGVKRKWRGTIR